ncbi:MAG: hypothetical protein HYZ37_16350 [Candidatus Solibacter usitatus]|nr:hypothetical protein [Candidatus Solibacter usitatus]
MSAFKTFIVALAAFALISAGAFAQVVPPITCSTTGQPLTMRSEGLAEQAGDVVMNCTGGGIPLPGTPLPQINISITLSVNITSRFMADPITEALLFIDDPQPATPGGLNGAQSPCAPGAGSTVCAPLVAGPVFTGTALDGKGAIINIFQGVRQNDNTIVFLAVPVSAPGVGGNRVFRIKNIRAAVAGSTATNGQIFAFLSIQNPPANLLLNTSTVNVGFVQQGVTFTLRSQTGGGFSSTTARVFNFICDSVNAGLAGSNSAGYGGSGSVYGRAYQGRFREAYAASWKVRDVVNGLTGPLTEPTALSGNQNVPQSNNGLDPTVVNFIVVESGFYNINFPATNGLNRAGRADHGTRLRMQFNNVQTNMATYVSVHALSSAAFINNNGSSQSSGGGETTAAAAAYAVASNSAGSNISTGTTLLFPTSGAEQVLGGNVAKYPAGATPGMVQVGVSGGTGSITWEVFGQTPNDIDMVSFAVAHAYLSSGNPSVGTMTVSGSFAPVGGGNTMSSSASIPRFADQSTPSNGASISPCRSNLLFPFVTNQVGFDTGIAISNTSQDPFGTAPQTGTCTLNYYGGTVGGGAAPAAQTTTSALNGGQHMTLTLSSGGTFGIAATPGFQGYIIAQCNFRYAHGFAFISDVGAQKLSHGYLALVMDTSGVGDGTNRTGVAGEVLGE